MTVGYLAGSDSLHRLYDTHQGWLQGWLRRKLGNAADAADLAQDTFLRILSNPVFPAYPDSEAGARDSRARLALIANGLVVDLWRRRALERAYLDAIAALPEPLAPSPESRMLVLDALYEIDAMLARLPDKVRRAFLMAQLDGMTYKAIGEQLGVSERMVRKYMAQAMLDCAMMEASFDLAAG